MKQGEDEERCEDCQLCLDEYRLELLRDTDILLMFEKGIRQGITQAVKRYAKANNEYINNQYNHHGKSTYLQYLVANNILVLAIIQKLLTQGFVWEK